MATLSLLLHLLLVFAQLGLYLVVLSAAVIATLLIAAALHYRTLPVVVPGSASGSASTSSSPSSSLVVGFFHPYCNSGGGGERVLWQVIHTLHSLSPSISCVVYTGDTDATPQQIQQRAIDRFNLPPFTRPVTFIYLNNRHLLSPHLYPHFTILVQSLASLPVAFSALTRFKPHVFFDSTGFPFTYPLAALIFGCRVVTYTHYPTISTDMLQLVFDRRPSYNNHQRYAGQLGSAVKLAYYAAFAGLYALAGQCTSTVMVNSRWTYSHIARLWRNTSRIHLVYPPCHTRSLQQLPLLKVRTLEDVRRGVGAGGAKDGYREDVVVSVGQFRPEKDHALQLRAFTHFRGLMKAKGQLPLVEHVRLVLIGGARDRDDEQRVEQLRALAAQLSIASHVTFLVNPPFSTLSSHLASALVGLHSMWNEHFGMGVVEAAAAGLLVLAHDSGGPREDIVVETEVGKGRCGLLAGSTEGYAEALAKVFGSEWKGGEEMEGMRRRGREWCCSQFSDERFEARVHEVFKAAELLPLGEAGGRRKAE